MVIDTFQAHGEDYEIRLSGGGSELVVRAFFNDRPANGYSYHVTLETAHDLGVLAGQNAVKELAKVARSDVIEQRYEKLLQVLKTTQP